MGSRIFYFIVGVALAVAAVLLCMGELHFTLVIFEFIPIGNVATGIVSAVLALGSFLCAFEKKKEKKEEGAPSEGEKK